METAKVLLATTFPTQARPYPMERLKLYIDFLLTKKPATQLLAPRAARLWGLGAPQHLFFLDHELRAVGLGDL